MHTSYASPTIRQLRDQQVRSAATAEQIQQADSAEKLLDELDPQRTYTWQYVCHRVTNNGHELDPALSLRAKTRAMICGCWSTICPPRPGCLRRPPANGC